ncbi:MAG: FRG domain-containing protein [Kiritimatiellae bacterium]|nr:FRG domain-containing protein [Kiritimatiellia bacterium]MDD5520316.1 FRG domain-containing protein [Kiritimatiellia bacterium]
MNTSDDISQEFRQLAELVKLICDVESNWMSHGWSMCWFRGAKTRHDLIPGQYRPTYKASQSEESTFLEFQQRARGFLRKEMNDWEVFFIMQHYRLPTRLLDWTENCFVALYFALIDADPQGDPCVWCFNPLLFNKCNSPTRQQPLVVTPDSTDPDLKYWVNAFHPVNFNPDQKIFTDKTGRTESIENPIAIYPPTIDPRIISQRSVFTLHGSKREPIDMCCDLSQNVKKDMFRRFVFKGLSKEVLRELRCFGISRQAIFPDLEGLGLELREKLMF